MLQAGLYSGTVKVQKGNVAANQRIGCGVVWSRDCVK